MTNKEMTEKIFYFIKSIGFKIFDIDNVDGYFISDYGKDSVTHFKLKGHHMWRHWKFAIWCFEEYSNENDRIMYKQKYNTDPTICYVFAQHDTLIDKFKPSRSALCVSFTYEEMCDFLNGKYDCIDIDLQKMLQMMCKHPLMCYNDFCGKYATYTDECFIKNFSYCECIRIKDNLVKNIKKVAVLPWIKLKTKLASMDKCNVKIQNKNSK